MTSMQIQAPGKLFNAIFRKTVGKPGGRRWDERSLERWTPLLSFQSSSIKAPVLRLLWHVSVYDKHLSTWPGFSGLCTSLWAEPWLLLPWGIQRPDSVTKWGSRTKGQTYIWLWRLNSSHPPGYAPCIFLPLPSLGLLHCSTDLHRGKQANLTV